MLADAIGLLGGIGILGSVLVNLSASRVARKADGADAPLLPLGTNLDGEEIDTSRYAGKVLAVAFWAPWCGPSSSDLSLLEGIQRSAGKSRLEVIVINVEDLDTYRKLARGLKWFSIGIHHDTGGKASNAFGVEAIPHIVVIGRDGRIIGVHRGGGAIHSAIAEIRLSI